MKNSVLFIYALLSFFLTSWSQSTTPIGKTVIVKCDIENDFRNDSVSVQLDSVILMEQRITTDYRLSLAWSGSFKILSGDKHILHFTIIESGLRKDLNVCTLNDTSTITIRFIRDSLQIEMIQFKGIVLRD